MKLQKIKDVRVGQIWTFNEGKTYDVVIDVRNIDRHLQDCLYEVNFIIYCDDKYLSGKTKEQDKDRLYFFDAEFCRQGENINKELLEKFKEPDKYLVGFLGITHKIEDGRLVEIERKKFEEDDIVERSDRKYIITYASRDSNEDYNTYNINEIDNLENETYALSTDLKKLGTLGINYEFINNKLEK